MATYRAAVIGLGWMGLLYDLAQRMGVWHVDDIDRPTPELDIQRRFHYHQHHLPRHLPTSYSEALHDRPEVELIAAAERDPKRLKAFGARYGIDALYTDAVEMLKKERPDIVAIATNTKGRADLTCHAVDHGAKGIITEKPIAYTLAQADRMVNACAKAGVPLVTGAISTSHPSFAKAKELLQSGTIGELVSFEAVSNKNMSQHQNWAYFIDGSPAWVIGTDDEPKRESGSAEFRGQGMMITQSGQVVFFRKEAPCLRLTGTSGEILHQDPYGPWRLWQTLETAAGEQRLEVPWPAPQMQFISGTIHGIADLIDCMEGRLDEPKNSGRSVAMAFETEVAIKHSAALGGVRLDLPLEDRSMGLEYDWHR
jgi:hypothetical protein